MRKTSFRPCLEVLEARINPDYTISSGVGNLSWNDADTWRNDSNNPLGRLPGPNDDVVVSQRVFIPAGSNITVHGLQVTGSLIERHAVAGGPQASLTVTGTLQVNGIVAVGGQMTVNGSTLLGQGILGVVGQFTSDQGLNVTGGTFLVGRVGTATVGCVLTNNAGGTIELHGGTVTAPMIQNAGRMESYGTINGDVTNTGTLSLGRRFYLNPTTINGDFSNSGTLQVRVDGDESGSLQVSGDVTANGTMTTEVVGAEPGRNDSFPVITYCGSLTGRFGNPTFTMNSNPYHLDFRPNFITIAPTPQAMNDECNVNQGGSVNVPVLSNDECPYGTAAIIAINGAPFTVGTPITLPSGATVTVNSDGTITYAPSDGMYLNDCLQYTMSDNAADPDNTGTSTAIVNVTVNRVLLYGPGDRTDFVNATVFLSLMGWSSAGNPLSYSATGLPPGVTLQDGLLGSALIGGTISSDAAGTYAVSITATDDALGISTTINFTWTVNAFGTLLDPILI